MVTKYLTGENYRITMNFHQGCVYISYMKYIIISVCLINFFFQKKKIYISSFQYFQRELFDRS